MSENIIFVSADELSWNALSCSGNQYVKTPVMDRLAALGISFERSYCTNPVCAPARASWITGLYSSETGVPFNDGCCHNDLPNLGEHLRSHGYRTFHSGKWHVLGLPIEKGFEVLYKGKREILAGPSEVYDRCLREEAIHFLSTYQDDAPFFLEVNFINPHDICEYLHSFEDTNKKITDIVSLGIIKEEELPPLPYNFNAEIQETVLHIVSRRIENALIHDKIRTAVSKWSELEWRCYIWHYYRYVERLDMEIGKFISAFENSRFCENTTLLFTVDHGESLASHGLFQKFTLYEECIRVPMFVYDFKKNSSLLKNYKDSHSLVSGVDIFKTVCDIAEIPYPDNIHGYSFWPECTGKHSTKPREFIFVESNCFGRAIIKGKYKLVTEYKPNSTGSSTIVNHKNNTLGRCQLFNLEDDPWETQDISDENPKIVFLLHQLLFQQETSMFFREMTHDKGRQVFTDWSSRILNYWNLIT